MDNTSCGYPLCLGRAMAVSVPLKTSRPRTISRHVLADVGVGMPGNRRVDKGLSRCAYDDSHWGEYYNDVLCSSISEIGGDLGQERF